MKKKSTKKRKSTRKRSTTKLLENTVHSVSQFASLLKRADKQENILFRGQANDWPLLPKVARLSLKSIPPYNGSRRFTEARLFDEFKRIAWPLHNNSDLNLWDILALGQHHGLPTRMMDWTRNPLVALWFAVSRPPTPKNKSDSGIVWIYMPTDDEFFDPSKRPDDPFSIERTKVLDPKHIAARIINQSGLFTVRAYYPDHGGFIPFEENKLRAGELFKVRIPFESFCEIRYELDRYGTNSYSVFLIWTDCRVTSNLSIHFWRTK